MRLCEAWHRIRIDHGSAEAYIARTKAILEAGRLEPTLYWNRTSEEAVVVGPSVRGSEIDPSFDSVHLVRRQSGGGAVLLGPGVLGMDVFLPAGHSLLSGDVVKDYRWLGEVWQGMFRRLGIETRLISVADAREQTRRASRTPEAKLACFGLYSPFEVAVGAKKIVGLSQVRRSSGVLFASAVHIHSRPSDLARVLKLSGSSRRRLASHLNHAATSLDEVASRAIKMNELVKTFEDVLFDRYEISFSEAAYNESITDSWSAATVPE